MGDSLARAEGPTPELTENSESKNMLIIFVVLTLGYVLSCLGAYVLMFPLIDRVEKLAATVSLESRRAVARSHGLDAAEVEGVVQDLGWRKSVLNRIRLILSLPWSVATWKRRALFLLQAESILDDEEIGRLISVALEEGLPLADRDDDGTQSVLAARDFQDGLLFRRLSPWAVFIFWHSRDLSRAAGNMSVLPFVASGRMHRLEERLIQDGFSVLCFRAHVARKDADSSPALVVFSPFDPLSLSMVDGRLWVERAWTQGWAAACFLLVGKSATHDKQFSRYLAKEKECRSNGATPISVSRKHKAISLMANEVLGEVAVRLMRKSKA